MTDKELQNIASDLFRKYWNMDLTISVSVNPKMYKWSARCYPMTVGKH
jgi:hypothetical protein